MSEGGGTPCFVRLFFLNDTASDTLYATPKWVFLYLSYNLDAKGIELYKNLIDKYHQDRIILVCSNNIKDEFEFCDQVIDVSDYKK